MAKILITQMTNITRESGLIAQKGIANAQIWKWGPFAIQRIKIGAGTTSYLVGISFFYFVIQIAITW